MHNINQVKYAISYLRLIYKEITVHGIVLPCIMWHTPTSTLPHHLNLVFLNLILYYLWFMAHGSWSHENTNGKALNKYLSCSMCGWFPPLPIVMTHVGCWYKTYIYLLHPSPSNCTAGWIGMVYAWSQRWQFILANRGKKYSQICVPTLYHSK